MRCGLSVNVNKVALLRNSRNNGIPDVVQAAQQCLEAGAAGITVHPRPDARHITTRDVANLHALMQDWPDREFNIEGNPLHNLMTVVRMYRPDQVTFVPDTVEQFTSDHGWNLPRDQSVLLPLAEECRALGMRVSLFMDATPVQMPLVKACGADRVELYTESWAQACDDASGTAQEHREHVLQQFVQTAHAAQQAGLGVNAGHDLNLYNLPAFARAIPFLAEVSIGHAFIADALQMGYKAATRAYLHALTLDGVDNTDGVDGRVDADSSAGIDTA